MDEFTKLVSVLEIGIFFLIVSLVLSDSSFSSVECALSSVCMRYGIVVAVIMEVAAAV